MCSSGLTRPRCQWRSSGVFARGSTRGLASAEDRVDALESWNQATQRVIGAAARSVVFVQGSYGFLEPELHRPLRLEIGPAGQPVSGPGGAPLFTASGSGPLLERPFSGTAFIATDNGLLLTNRHIAQPWEFDEWARALTAHGMVPVMHRLIGYLPDITEPFDIELVAASETADIAVLRCSSVAELALRSPSVTTLCGRVKKCLCSATRPGSERCSPAPTKPSSTP